MCVSLRVKGYEPDFPVVAIVHSSCPGVATLKLNPKGSEPVQISNGVKSA